MQIRQLPGSPVPAHRRPKRETRAAVAVAHSIMIFAYHLLARKADYKDLGSLYFEQRQQDAMVRQAVRKLENLGFQVALSNSEAS
jgi:transposase